MKSRTRTLRFHPASRHAFVDLTDELGRVISESGVTEGCAVVFCAHTTCTLLINEWESGAMEDMRERLDALVPADRYYAHDDLERRTQNLSEAHERRNGQAPVAQMLLGGSSHSIPVAGGEAHLGRWQRLLLLELDEPKGRDVVFHVFGE